MTTKREISNEPEILELESFLPYRLYRLADAVSREFSRIYKDRHGLTRPEWRTLAGLGQHGTMTATALGEQSAMHKTKVSRAVAELERRRWLTRTPDEKDRRIEHLMLTKAGHAAYREMVPLAKAFELELLTRLSTEERAAVVSGVAALEGALGEDRPPNR
ncbi:MULTISPECIES: MarR family winged helix-turn-helix transcriptional regulator [unclassified Mesorhizobium]|uniref:MarR family winged helix-turn-helix transcriptional regulator n=1 Tax=unclassified Mesorhizobium TaxID=325217 RepID=UPI000F7656B7|nr:MULTISPECIES: MarR family transcriptional regulator [unclassified Mesorhizobium]AZO68983.1 MarR family transcriptional regulator [Mesorhizobium sp. M6A.T.Cr.TU.016.01.1.1]RUU45100.1 MarR family transcriptional regulator [Mesorhizobium sp. M6A.T.Ce.TU.002.03.1.1]RWP45569.1 MAG: MarR family transcriptional regulator [Mesorhizobium sp.]RWP56172.1 MAG: MarR family transcriptional regulator [Mesorhizobium sp.]RWQ82827.1 MAG: MarR family transcriptional regulator [Mesorhizobium sp.]